MSCDVVMGRDVVSCGVVWIDVQPFDLPDTCRYETACEKLINQYKVWDVVT